MNYKDVVIPLGLIEYCDKIQILLLFNLGYITSPKLKRLIKRLLMPFNIQVPVTVNCVKFKAFIMQGVGGSNFELSEQWMIDVLGRLLFLRLGAAFVDVGVNMGQTC